MTPRGQSKRRPPHTAGLIACDDDLRSAIRVLRRRCPDMRRLHDLVGDPPLRRYPPGLEGLARIVVGQQLSVASAEAIWARTRTTIAPFTAETVLALDEATLQSAGLSRPKIRTLKALAGTIADRRIDIAALATLPDEEVHAALVAVPGIGPWTADIFLMFCAGRADAWASGDLALQIAVQIMRKGDERPSAEELASLAERWRPYRAVAALLLWSYYKIARNGRAGVPV